MTPRKYRLRETRLWRLAFQSVRVLAMLAVASVVVTLGSCGGDGGPTVPEPVITRIDVSTPTSTLSPQQTVQLTAVARTADGTAVSGPVVWSSSANGVATVNSSGLVTAVAVGSVTISAARNGISGTTPLTVVAAGGVVASLTVTLSDPTVQIGDLAQASVTARDINNAVIALGAKPLTWSSTNTSVATVSAGGVISAIGIGTTNIRASVVEGATTLVSSEAFGVIPNPDAKITADVEMPGETFSPVDVVVKVNGTVRFIFPPKDHNVIWRPRITGSPTDIDITASQIVTRAFPLAGVFPYTCTLHNGMNGTVVVSP